MKQHPLLISLPLYGLDQATKWWIVHHIEYRVETVSVIPGFFDLVYWGNTGAAFSAFTGNNYPFTILSVVTLAGLLIAWARGSFREPLYRWGVGLLMAGILGNVTDRLNPARQHVVDFLLFDLHLPFADPWPAFNVADSCICIAVGLFLLAAFRESRNASRTVP
jgi:signal peptidase II